MENFSAGTCDEQSLHKKIRMRDQKEVIMENYSSRERETVLKYIQNYRAFE